MIKKLLSSFFSLSSVPGDLSEVRNKLVNAILALSVIFGFPILLLAVLRIPVTGLLTNTFLGGILYCIILLLLIFSKKIGYRFKVLVFVFACYLMGTASWWSAGVMGAGFQYLLIGSLLATMLINERAGIHLVLTSIITALVIGLLFLTDRRQYTFPVEEYVHSVFPWALQFGVAVFFTTLIMLVFSILNRFAENSARYYNQQSKKLAEINRDLKEEVAERKRIESAYRASEEKFRSIFFGIRDLILITTPDGEIREANTVFVETTGYTIEEVRKMKVFDFMEKEEYGYIKKIFEGVEYEALPMLEISLTGRNGRKIPVEVAAFPLQYGSENLLLYVARNITERKLLEQKMLQAIVNGEEKERARLAGDLHDELGPLLSTGKMYVQMLQEEPDAYQQKILIGKIYENIDSALRTMREISNNLSPHLLRHYGMQTALESYFDKIQEAYPVTIHTEVGFSERLPEIYETSLYRAIIELVNNSLRHGEASSIALKIFKKDDFVIVEYSDNGKGFDVSVLERPGKGLGLPGIRSRIESLAGKFIAASEVGKGVIFKFFIPIRPI
ncbi:MAG TPA: PAS domain S-box protein [Bacteroidales bacterium]|nr:PAS domain S-box protein [Bacteroidales bacterium]